MSYLSPLLLLLLQALHQIGALDNYDATTYPGGVQDPEESFNPAYQKVHDPSAVTIPEYFDARSKWPYCSSIGEIRDQGACGSCWSFAAAEVMSDRLCIASQGQRKMRVSSEDLLECCSECIFNASNKCQAGYAFKAWDYWINNGIVSGGDALAYDDGCKPYSWSVYHSAQVPACQSTCSNGETITPLYKNYGAQYNWIRNNPVHTQIEIMTSGPVHAYIDFHDNMRRYEGSIFIATGPKIGGHFLKLIGWGKSKADGSPYWIAINSFGTNWGIDGVILVPRGSNYINIESQITFGTPRLN